MRSWRPFSLFFSGIIAIVRSQLPLWIVKYRIRNSIETGKLLDTLKMFNAYTMNDFEQRCMLKLCILILIL